MKIILLITTISLLCSTETFIGKVVDDKNHPLKDANVEIINSNIKHENKY